MVDVIDNYLRKDYEGLVFVFSLMKIMFILKKKLLNNIVNLIYSNNLVNFLWFKILGIYYF